MLSLMLLTISTSLTILGPIAVIGISNTNTEENAVATEIVFTTRELEAEAEDMSARRASTKKSSIKAPLDAIDYDSPLDESVGGYFDQLDEEELSLPTKEFTIQFATHQLDYSIIAPRGPCDPSTELFVFIPTRPEAFYTRQKIRETWGANSTSENIAVKFVIGWPRQQQMFDELLDEFIFYADTILYDIEDTYANLYLKVYVALRYQRTYCPGAQFILKTDDDTVVDLIRLRWWIDNEFTQKVVRYSSSVFGGLWRGVKVIRESQHKWHVPRSQYPKSRYPPYMNGPTYLLSKEAVVAIMNATTGVNAFAIEDVLYTGVLAERAHVHKFSAWQHFRYGKYMYVHERCKRDQVDGRPMPYVTAIYGIADPNNIKRAFEELRSVNCSVSWSAAKRALWNSIFTD